MPVYIKGQLARVGSPLWTMWGLGLNSDHQALQQAPLPTELACWPHEYQRMPVFLLRKQRLKEVKILSQVCTTRNDKVRQRLDFKSRSQTSPSSLSSLLLCILFRLQQCSLPCPMRLDICVWKSKRKWYCNDEDIVPLISSKSLMRLLQIMKSWAEKTTVKPRLGMELSYQSACPACTALNSISGTTCTRLDVPACSPSTPEVEAGG